MRAKVKSIPCLIRLALLPTMLLACAAMLQAAEVSVSVPESPMLRFALGKLEATLQEQGASGTEDHRQRRARGHVWFAGLGSGGSLGHAT